MIRSDIKELLEGFSERMKFLNLVRSLSVKTSDITIPVRDMVGTDTDLLNNLVMAVLLFIKDRTLGVQMRCSRSDIADFLEELRPIIPDEYKESYDPQILSEFIMINILQNSGKLREYMVYDDRKEAFTTQNIRLVNEEKGSFTLTDDVLDFLFRSKEIESELDYSVTRFKLAEYMKRQNYTQALDQSKELVERIRQLRTSMDSFIVRCRENLVSIMMEDYQRIITRYSNLLDSEYDELNTLQQQTEAQIEQARAAIESGLDNEDTAKNLSSLTEISKNLMLTVNEQRKLINKRDEFASSYEQIIRDSFQIRNYEHMDFKKDILIPLQKSDNALDGFAQFFTWPLAKPSFAPIFSIENFYAEARLNDDEEKDNGIDLTDVSNDDTSERDRNERYKKIMRSFFHYATEHDSFTIREYIRSLSVDDIMDMSEENTLPAVILHLYSLGQIDVRKMVEDLSNDISLEPRGEFDLFTFLSYVPVNDRKMAMIAIDRTGDDFSFVVEDGDDRRTIQMSDFKVEVTR